MPRITIYSSAGCRFCRSAKRLLERHSIAYREIELSMDDEGRALLAERTGRRTFPQVFVDGAPIGGYDDLVQHPFITAQGSP